MAGQRMSRGLALAVVVGCFTVTATWAQDEAPLAENSVIAPLAARSLLLDVAMAGDTAVAVGDRGHVLLSEDGADWRQVIVPTRAMLTAVAFHDSDYGLAVGHDSVILRTMDGGESWERVHWAPEDEAPLLDVWIADDERALAIGAYGTTLVSRDGGVSWDFESIIEEDSHLNHIAEGSNGRVFIAAEWGMVFRSDDSGETWKILPSPYEGSLFGALALDDDGVLVFGLRGHLFRSGDAGETWEQVDTQTVAMLTDGVRLEDGRIVVVGLGGVLLVSDDGGASFELARRPDRAGIEATVRLGADRLVLAGEQGVTAGTVAELAAGQEEGQR